MLPQKLQNRRKRHMSLSWNSTDDSNFRHNLDELEDGDDYVDDYYYYINNSNINS